MPSFYWQHEKSAFAPQKIELTSPPASYITLHRLRQYVQVHASSSSGLRKNIVFSTHSDQGRATDTILGRPRPQFLNRQVLNCSENTRFSSYKPFNSNDGKRNRISGFVNDANRDRRSTQRYAEISSHHTTPTSSNKCQVFQRVRVDPLAR